MGNIRSTAEFVAATIFLGAALVSRRQGDEIQGVTPREANPGTDAMERGLYAYNPVTVPLTRAGETHSTVN
jgi:hypothetical protein